MKKTILFGCFVLIFAFSTLGVFAQTVHRPFNGNNLEGWKPVDSNPDTFLWITGNVDLDQDHGNRSFISRAIASDDSDSRVMINMAGPDWGRVREQRGVDLYTEQTFGDCTVEIEFMVAKNSNSGVYLMGEYEVQVLDSWGKTGELSQGDVGAIYSAAAPKVNASLEPGKWQKFVIDFEAPRFDADGKKIKDARFLKITLNGKVVQENVDVTKGSTGGGITGQESAKGPLMLQGNHGPVAYRNIIITEK